jgi:GTP cyclohydrolase II
MDTEGRVEKSYQKYGFQRTEEAGGDTAEAETAEA